MWGRLMDGELRPRGRKGAREEICAVAKRLQTQMKDKFFSKLTETILKYILNWHFWLMNISNVEQNKDAHDKQTAA